jgi:hypothetical protein
MILQQHTFMEILMIGENDNSMNRKMDQLSYLTNRYTAMDSTNITWVMILTPIRIGRTHSGLFHLHLMGCLPVGKRL